MNKSLISILIDQFQSKKQSSGTSIESIPHADHNTGFGAQSGISVVSEYILLYYEGYI